LKKKIAAHEIFLLPPLSSKYKPLPHQIEYCKSLCFIWT